MVALCEAAKKSKSEKLNYISFNITASILHKSYDPLVKNIQELIKLRDKTKSPLQINIPILVSANIPDSKKLKNIQNRMLGIGVDKIRYSFPQIPISTKNVINRVKLIRDLQDSGGVKVFVRSKSEKQYDRCYVMANTISIDHNGKVYPCSQTCSSFFEELSYGSIKKNRLDQIWDGKKHNKLFTCFDQITAYCRCNSADNQFNAICSSFD